MSAIRCAFIVMECGCVRYAERGGRAFLLKPCSKCGEQLEEGRKDDQLVPLLEMLAELTALGS